ncbi:phage tail assembly protein [Algicola sagamiensis]|uniref:phage tail assembly protein n=1 Tax=Algicola sagamiensis TaxID=163869 RepID=UPI000361C98B|nr:phage tail assembly protein [Algicola sagamiensis]
MKTNELTLQDPIERHGESIAVLTFRVPTVRDLELVDDIESTLKRTIHIMANVCQWTPDEVSALSIRDYKAFEAALFDFLE